MKAYISASKYRAYERMDAILNKLIQLLASAGKDQQAREFFVRLERDYPKSRHLPAATIALADGACGAGHLDDAVALYERVEQRYQSAGKPGEAARAADLARAQRLDVGPPGELR